jgi:hypothetical protein
VADAEFVERLKVTISFVRTLMAHLPGLGQLPI